jgi:hypothetical protein
VDFVAKFMTKGLWAVGLLDFFGDGGRRGQDTILPRPDVEGPAVKKKKRAVTIFETVWSQNIAPRAIKIAPKAATGGNTYSLEYLEAGESH